MDFSHLLPDVILSAVEDQGYCPTGVFTPLNSYENRVYLIELEDAPALVAKFYRPERWTKESILEEHRFVYALLDNELPVVAPLPLKKSVKQGTTLGLTEKIYYALYPRFRGRERDELSLDDRRILGRLLARMHLVGENFKAPHRISLLPQTYGYQSLEFILTQPFLPPDIKSNLEIVLTQALKLVENAWSKNIAAFPVHGDCHLGNILWNDKGPHFVDFDDMVIAPPVQDLWMLFHGTSEEVAEQKKSFFEGYDLFRDFDFETLRFVEPLRTLRQIKYAAWIGERYLEPAFQRAFPYYEQRRYWEEFLQAIKEQLSALQGL